MDLSCPSKTVYSRVSLPVARTLRPKHRHCMEQVDTWSWVLYHM